MRDGINYSGGWVNLPQPRMETATILLSVTLPTTQHFRGRVLADDNLILDDGSPGKLGSEYCLFFPANANASTPVLFSLVW